MLSSKNQNDMQGGCIMGTELTRRSFLTGLGVAGIAAAGAGLAGCAPAANDSAAATGNGGKAAGANGAAANDTEFIAASYVLSLIHI